MKVFNFTHFYMASVHQTIEDVQEQCSRIGRNPLFLTNNNEICGYILFEDIQATINRSASVTTIMKQCPIVTFGSDQNARIQLISRDEKIIAWTFGKEELPRYAVHEIEPQRIHDFGLFTPWLIKISETAEQCGCPIYMAGGVVRDFILQTEIRDIDFVVQGDLFRLVDSLHKNFGGILNKEILFDAAHWTTPDGDTFDFTVARSEHYASPATIPQVQKGTILDDIMRRDFSINSMLISMQSSNLGCIIDATDGIQGLKEKSLHILHDQSFRDDPTRIFRGARYAGRYRLARSHRTKNAMELCLSKGYLTGLPFEQVGKELQKIFQEKDSEQAWNLLKDWNVLEHLFGTNDITLTPTLAAWQEINQQGICPKIDKCLLLWLCFIMQISNDTKFHPLTNILKGGAKLWSAIAPSVRNAEHTLHDTQNNGDIGAILYKLTPESLVYLYQSHPSSIKWWLITGIKRKTVVNGTWLVNEGCPKGPYIGEALRKAQYAAWMGYAHEEQRKIAKNVWIE